MSEPTHTYELEAEMATETPQVYVACLAAYNAGKLHGKWVDATDADEIHEAIAEVLRTSPEPGAEEWAFHDYSGFGEITRELGEYASVERVAEIGALIEQHGEEFLAWASIADGDYNEVRFDEARCGQFDSEKDYAYEFVDSCGWGGLAQIPDELSSYLDWDLIARDLFDVHSFVNGYVFRSDV